MRDMAQNAANSICTMSLVNKLKSSWRFGFKSTQISLGQYSKNDEYSPTNSHLGGLEKKKP